MSKGFYLKLAAGNVKKNGQTYFPYIITCILMIAMYYIMYSLSINEGIIEMRGGYWLVEMMGFGCWIVGIFATVFLFYTNSFLMKRRKKEIGLWNILGMEKRHILKVVAMETIYIALLGLVLGILTGIIFEKLMYLIILQVMNREITLGFHIYGKAIVSTLLVFTGVFVVIFIKSMFQVSLSKPIELLQGSAKGEREPKTKWVLAVLGVLTLGSGYALSIVTDNPVQAISIMFLAVLLVIAGTYCLFTAGSIVWLKLLRKKKNYYYQSRHFTTVSGMLYRMKRNAVGLANICVLSTMVLVMISTTTSLMLGMEDSIARRYPYDFTVNIQGQELADPKLDTLLQEQIVSYGQEIEDSIRYSYLSLAGIQDENAFCFEEEGIDNSITQGINILNFITLEDYNRITGLQKQLNENEILVYRDMQEYPYSTVQLFDKEYQVMECLNSYPIPQESSIFDVYYFVARDSDVLRELDMAQSQLVEKKTASITTCYGYQLRGNEEQQVQMTKEIRNQLINQGYNAYVESSADAREDFLGTYGGLFFLGIFLGFVFLIATILIIYYKQISEGFEDKERFEIMQKVGMSQTEVKQSIRSQILTVFFLPLLTAGIHMAFAFPLMSRLLRMLGLVNINLFVLCVLMCFLVFGAFYGIVYSLTAKVYYRIVRR